MSQISASELATELNLSKGRISQYVAAGKLNGCFQGEGRARRFDLDKVATALGRKLDKGQMLGNGLQTRRAIRTIQAGGGASPEEQKKPAPRRDGKLDEGDADELELVKIATANEQLRKLRRDNALAEGHYVLAAAVERQVARAIRQEVAAFETVLREGARAIADQLGVEFKAARKILTDLFRDHRKARVDVLAAQDDVAEKTEAEKAADI